MNDLHAIAHVTSAAGVGAVIWSILAQVNVLLQIVVAVTTIAALCWSMLASRAKKRHYDRINS